MRPYRALLRHTLVIVAIVLLSIPSLATAQNEDPLPRRAFMGARLSVMPDTLKASVPEQGVLITHVFPQSSALESGLQANDIVLRLAGEAVMTPGAIISLLGQHRVGDQLAVEFLRDGMRQELVLTLRPFPEENYDGIDVRYDHVATTTGMLRSIVTRPSGAQGRVPLIYILQGYDCGSIDLPFAPNSDLARLVRHFSRLGFATYRVEKSGVGDSQGAPCSEAGFHTETQGFLDGLHRVKQYDFVDPDQVYLLGLSMGGIWSPILASQEPVKGVMVYGTIAKPWVEYMQENWRRQWVLQGRDYAHIEQELKEGQAMWHYLLTEGLSPSEIVARYPQLQERVAAEASDPDTPPIEHFYGRHYRFIQELNEINIAEQWRAVEAPVLAMWGRGDYVSSRGDHQLIIDLVNRYRPGQATLVEVDADHWFNTATSFAESYTRMRSQQPGTFNEDVLLEMEKWLEDNKL